MNDIERLVDKYQHDMNLPWDHSVAGQQRVWFIIYEPTQERRLRLHVEDFEVATKEAKHSWRLVDLTDTFPQWMAQHEYREAYFAQPEDMDLALEDYASHVIEIVKAALTAPDVDHNTVVAVMGLASLFGLMRASVLFERVAPFIRGRLVAFFPGHKDGANYRLLDARDGWNYLAYAITANDEA